MVDKVKGEKKEDVSILTHPHIERTFIAGYVDGSRIHLDRELIAFPEGVKSRSAAIDHRIENAKLKRKVGKNQVGLMVKCTPERGQKCSLFHLMVKCTPIIVELPSVYRGCKPLICFQ